MSTSRNQERRRVVLPPSSQTRSSKNVIEYPSRAINRGKPTRIASLTASRKEEEVANRADTSLPRNETANRAGPSDWRNSTVNRTGSSHSNESVKRTDSSGSRSTMGNRTSTSRRFNSWKERLTMMQGDIETTAVALEQLLIENDWSKAQLERELEDLKANLDKYTDTYLDMINYANEHDIDTKNLSDRRQRYLIRFKSIRNMLLKAISDKTTQANEPESDREEIADANVQLPKVEIPTFHGDPEQWHSWHSLYESLVHKNKIVNRMGKFQYLHSLLKGSAFDLIAGFPFEKYYYKSAYKAVVNHYDDPLDRVARVLDSMQRIDHIREKDQTHRKILAAYRAHATTLQIIFQRNPDIDPLSQLLIHSYLSKTDRGTRNDWEQEVGRRERFVTFEEFITYQENRCSAFERAAPILTTSVSSSKNKANEKQLAKQKPKVFATTTKTAPAEGGSYEKLPLRCYFCDAEHTIYRCGAFMKLTLTERQNQVKAKGLCKKCLSPRCNQSCTSSCRSCKKEHNLLLHDEKDDPPNTRNLSGNNLVVGYDNVRNVDSNNERLNIQIARSWIGNITGLSAEALLATLELTVTNIENEVHVNSRALIDSASQSNLISTRLAQQLKLQPKPTDQQLTSIQGQCTQPKGSVDIRIQSKNSTFNFMISCEIIDEIVDLVPSRTFEIETWKIPRNIRLADPAFNIAEKVDMLLGLRIFWQILGTKILVLGDRLPCLRSTKMGWIVTDNREVECELNRSKINVFAITTTDELAETIRKFWSLPDSDSGSSTFEEVECEKEFLQSTIRTLEGTFGYFTVKFPFKVSPSKLGASKSIAMKHFLSLERRFARDPKLKIEYSAVIRDFIESRHMQEIQETPDTLAYYIPHHAVLKETSTTTKLRTVVNASMPTTSGLSLNDCLMVGPVIQSDLITVLLRFRIHRFVFTADITKMYRQVRLNEEHTKFQRILWRFEPSEDIKTFEITRLAFGTASAPFLATRCLRALAELDGQLYPEAAPVLTHDFYMDDVLTGSTDLSRLEEIRNQLQEILARGGFVLSKWCSNSVEFLEQIPPEQRENLFPFSLDKDDKVVKSLGLLWSANNDSYQIRVQIGDFAAIRSKRFILSIIASIFDPLGFLAPVTISAKILMQRLWEVTKSPRSPKSVDHWDEATPNDLWEVWLQFASQLPQLHHVSIPRYLFHSNFNYKKLELHGFSDASTKAYGAVIYVRAITKGQVTTALLFAKSRVAPLKEQTIPRLELCAALLLSEAIEKIKASLADLLRFERIRLWTDSQVVLHWISGAPGRWLPFVANRVQKIQQHSENAVWDYVPSKENPADLISRGVEPNKLKDATLWWDGPEWLKSEKMFSEKTEFKSNPNSNELELRKSKRSLSFVTQIKSSIFSITNDFWKLSRIVAWISRFVLNAHFLGPLFSGPLQVVEIREAKNTLVRIAQSESFKIEYKRLKEGREVDRNSQLRALAPFVDSLNLIRVGGRLTQSNLTFQQQHPLVLHPKHALTKMIVKYYHELHFHAGPQLLKAILRNQFWILQINRAIQHCIRTCVKCVRAKAQTASQLMATLPRTRVTYTRAFDVTGVDYAGPFSTLGKGGRHPVLTKGYIAIFVCFTTKALHLEFVSDLSAQTFLAALDRFVSRRGTPREIWSDNGTNFVGAKNLLKREFIEFLRTTNETICDYASKNGCQWNFIPPHAPHFGGLWEAGVKSVKGQLKYVLSKKPFTFEQWVTVLSQIEACLNSRPLVPDSSDPSDISALTPGHFLVGGPLVGLPKVDFSKIPENRLKHWESVQAHSQRFWTRWRNEYLNTLQQRTKWRFIKEEVKLGEIVILKEENVPPSYWPLGKIVELFPGSDNQIRVVSIKTASGIFKRPITQLVLLPIADITETNSKN